MRRLSSGGPILTGRTHKNPYTHQPTADISGSRFHTSSASNQRRSCIKIFRFNVMSISAQGEAEEQKLGNATAAASDRKAVALDFQHSVCPALKSAHTMYEIIRNLPDSWRLRPRRISGCGDSEPKRSNTIGLTSFNPLEYCTSILYRMYYFGLSLLCVVVEDPSSVHVVDRDDRTFNSSTSHTFLAIRGEQRNYSFYR